MDATIIAAPSSTKNQASARDPEMHSTSKRGQWYFGMKAHSGADSDSGIVHSASVTAANVHDSQNSRLYGDSVYGKQKEALKAKVPKARDFTNKRACRNKPLTERDKEVNRIKSQTRAKVEHPFLTPKRICGFAKVRYRGLTNNANRVFAMMALLTIDK